MKVMHLACKMYCVNLFLLDTSFIISLIYLVYMLPDRIKPDHENVVYAVPVSEKNSKFITYI